MGRKRKPHRRKKNPPKRKKNRRKKQKRKSRRRPRPNQALRGLWTRRAKAVPTLTIKPSKVPRPSPARSGARRLAPRNPRERKRQRERLAQLKLSLNRRHGCGLRA